MNCYCKTGRQTDEQIASPTNCFTWKMNANIVRSVIIDVTTSYTPRAHTLTYTQSSVQTYQENEAITETTICPYFSLDAKLSNSKISHFLSDANNFWAVPVQRTPSFCQANSNRLGTLPANHRSSRSWPSKVQSCWPAHAHPYL